MSVTVRHLNADSSFHLIFSPEPHPTSSDLRTANGAYSVLVDPWLIGSSVVTAPWFAITNRIVPSCIQHLSELDDEPDVVICSQNKPDHTNKETLLQLRPEGKTLIVAEPGAAKAIKSWNHFDPNRVHGMGKYDHKARFGNSLRLHVPPLSPDGDAGEVNISFIPAKHYLTGLHNAFGITYQAPTRSRALAPVSTIDLPKTKYFHLPMSPVSLPPHSPHHVLLPPALPTMNDGRSEDTIIGEKSWPSPAHRHRPNISRSSNTASSELLTLSDQPALRPSEEDLRRANEQAAAHGYQVDFADPMTDHSFTFDLPTPPMSPKPDALTLSAPLVSPVFRHKTSVSSLSSSSASMMHRLSTSHRPPSIHPARPKAISILYMPHGLSLSELQPYIQNHLVRLPGALPLTLLLHSFDYAQNPWYLGGNVMIGAQGGIDIAKSLMARCWISAHDEQKDDRGVAVKRLKLQRGAAEEIRRKLLASDDNRSSGWFCDVRTLGVGKEILLSSDIRDLCAGSNGLYGSGNTDASMIACSLTASAG